MSVLSYGFLAPPTLFITLCLAGALIGLVWRRAGLALVLSAALCLFVAAMPVVSSLLLSWVEAGVADPGDLRAAQAIVVLGGDQRFGNGADIPDALGPLSVERAMFAAEAFRRLRVPVAVTGGRIPGARASSAELFKPVLERNFAVPVVWSEDRSLTTYENAANTATLLKPQKIGTVVLITQAWHLPRAIWSFERVGLHALPWPVPRTAVQAGRLNDFLPNAGGLLGSFYALHELIGGMYYRMRY